MRVAMQVQISPGIVPVSPARCQATRQKPCCVCKCVLSFEPLCISPLNNLICSHLATFSQATGGSSTREKKVQQNPDNWPSALACQVPAKYVYSSTKIIQNKRLHWRSIPPGSQNPICRPSGFKPDGCFVVCTVTNHMEFCSIKKDETTIVK